MDELYNKLFFALLRSLYQPSDCADFVKINHFCPEMFLFLYFTVKNAAVIYNMLMLSIFLTPG